jgi:hypothetical protein
MFVHQFAKRCMKFLGLFHARNRSNVDFLPRASASARNADPEQHWHLRVFDQTQRVGQASVSGHIMLNRETVPNAAVSVGPWLSQDPVFSATVLDQASVDRLSPSSPAQPLSGALASGALAAISAACCRPQLAPLPLRLPAGRRDPEAQISQGLLVGLCN